MDGGAGVSTPVNAFDTDASVSPSHVLALKIMETADLHDVTPDTIRDMSILDFGRMLAGFRISATDRALLGEAFVGQRTNNRGEKYRVTKLDFALASYGENYTVPSMMRQKTGTMRFDAGPVEKAEMIEAGYRRTLQFVASESWASWQSDGDHAPETRRGKQMTPLGCQQVHALDCAATSCFHNRADLSGECEWILKMKEDARAQAQLIRDARAQGLTSFIKGLVWEATGYPDLVAIGLALCFIVIGHQLDKSVGRLSRYMLRNIFGANETPYCDHCLRHWDIDASPLEDRSSLTENEQLRALISRGVAPTSGQTGVGTGALCSSPQSGVRRGRKTYSRRRTRSRTPSSSPLREQGGLATRQQQIAYQLDCSIAFEAVTHFTLRGVRQLLRWCWIAPTYAVVVWLCLRRSMWSVSLMILGLVLRQVGAPTLEQFLLLRSVEKSERTYLFKSAGIVSLAVIMGFFALHSAVLFLATVGLGNYA